MTWSSSAQISVSALLLLCWAGRARAQAQQDEVVLTSGATRADVGEILRSAFARDGITLEHASAAPECTGSLADPALRARVWVSWTPAAESGRRAGEMSLCFQDHCDSATRTLGPFAKLDARAREELITVIESGLSAMAESCHTPAAPADKLQDTSAARDAQAAAAATDRSSALEASPGPAKPEASLPAPEPVSSSTPLVGPAALPPAAKTPSDSAQPPSAAVAVDRGEPNTQGRRFAVGASYALARWGDGMLAQQLAAMIAYPVHAQPLYVGLELGFVPSFRGQREALAIDASCLRLALQLWARWSLSQSLAIDLQLGPALEWLRVEPAAATARVASGTHATSHADPLLFVRLGPSLRLFARWRVGLDVQLDGALIQRSFGFLQSDAAISVFSPDRFRPSLALNVQAEL